VDTGPNTSFSEAVWPLPGSKKVFNVFIPLIHNMVLNTGCSEFQVVRQITRFLVVIGLTKGLGQFGED
jgi:hypothetical protein